MKNLINNMMDWKISYDPYTDRFQIYDNIVLTKNISSFCIEKHDDVTIYLNKISSKPVLIEIKDIYDKFPVNIDDMVKLDIINLLKPYISKYA